MHYKKLMVKSLIVSLALSGTYNTASYLNTNSVTADSINSSTSSNSDDSNPDSNLASLDVSDIGDVITGNLTKLTAKTGFSNSQVIVTIGDTTQTINSDSEGKIEVITSKSCGTFSVQCGASVENYSFKGSEVIRDEQKEYIPVIVNAPESVNVDEPLTLTATVKGLDNLATETIPDEMDGTVSATENTAESTTENTADSEKENTTNSDIAYQWFRNDEEINGATDSSYTIPNSTEEDSGLYSVSVFYKGQSLKGAASKETNVSKKTQTIKGNKFYNLTKTEDIAEVALSNTANTEVSYQIVSGEDIAHYSELTRTLTFSENGTVVIKATAEETETYKEASSYIIASCSSRALETDTKSLTTTYNKKPHAFSMGSVNEMLSCTIQYAKAEDSSLSWSETAPADAGTYIVKMVVGLDSGETLDKCSQITIKPKSVKLKEFRAKTKKYDGSVYAELNDKLTGILSGDDVTMSTGIYEFTTADVGKNIPVKLTSGEFALAGADASNYTLDNYSIDDLVGTIQKATVVIKAVNKCSVQHDSLEPLTYTVTGTTSDIKGVKLSCNVSASSKPGKYVIKATVKKKNGNFKYKLKDGYYTILADKEPSHSNPTILSPTPTPSYTTVVLPHEKDPNPSWNTALDTTPAQNQVIDDKANEAVKPNEAVNPNEVPNQEPTSSPDDNLVGMDDPDGFEFTQLDARNSLVFDGISKNDYSGERFVEYWITKDSRVKTIDDNVYISVNGMAWSNSLVVDTSTSTSDIVDSKGSCAEIDNLVIYVKCNGIVREVVVRKFYCDRECPQLEVDGITTSAVRNANGTVVESGTPLTFNLKPICGLAGVGTVSYTYLDDAAQVTESTSWLAVQNNSITVKESFKGCIAIKVVDAIGNESVFYTDNMLVDVDPPVISGVEVGGMYPNEAVWTVTDITNLTSVTLDGKPVKAADSTKRIGLHTLLAVDSYGNSTEITFEVRAVSGFRKVLQSISDLIGGKS